MSIRSPHVVPRISVLLSVFNGKSNLKQTLNSIQQQTEPSWECIVVDDGSSDGSLDVLQEFAQKDPRFKILIHSKNIGLTLSLNEALEQASGNYIARHDVDDLSTADRFKKQADALDLNPNLNLFGCAYEILDQDGASLSVTKVATDILPLRNQLYVRNRLAHGSFMVRRSALVEVGGYRPLFRMAQDYDLILRLMEKGDVGALPDVLYRLRLVPSGGSLSRIELQNFYAELARECAALRRSGQSDVAFAERRVMSAPNVAIDPDLTRQRYWCLRALHLIKAGRVVEARENLRACTHPSLRKKVNQLRFVSFIPRRVFNWIARP